MSNQNSNNNWKLIAGLAGGAALGWWLNTDKGRAFRKDANVKLNEFGNTVSTEAQRQYEAAAESMKSGLESGKKSLNQTIETGKIYAERISETAKAKLNNASNTAENKLEHAETAFQKGANKAKANINAQAAKAQKIITNGQHV